jgi:hypothetical protein
MVDNRYNEIMAELSRLFFQFPKFMSCIDSSIDENDSTLQKRFGQAASVRLERYYRLWRTKIEQAASDHIVSNGWAFSTLSGVSSFESHIRATEFKDIYVNKTVEIVNTLEAIEEKLGGRRLGGIILYGYGNLYRENYFVECAKDAGILSSQNVYLIDCSLFYHIFAESSLNPLRKNLKDRQIKTRLLDYLENPDAQDDLKYIRDDLNPTRPTLHLFLGNTFCNTAAEMLNNAFNMTVRPDDFIVGEYANYPEEFFGDTSDDYVSKMAKSAAAELYSLPSDQVLSENVNIDSDCKATSITLVHPRTKVDISFQSMLRRQFNQRELTDGLYQLIQSERPLEGKLYLDTFRRLSSPTD